MRPICQGNWLHRHIFRPLRGRIVGCKFGLVELHYFWIAIRIMGRSMLQLTLREWVVLEQWSHRHSLILTLHRCRLDSIHRRITRPIQFKISVTVSARRNRHIRTFLLSPWPFNKRQIKWWLWQKSTIGLWNFFRITVKISNGKLNACY